MELSKVILTKTLGNPYHAIQHLSMLEDEGIVYHKDYRWHWDLGRLKSSIVSDTVAALLAAKVDRLKSTSFSQYVLQIAAFLGPKFDWNLVEIILLQDDCKDGEDEADDLEKVARCFKRAVKEELIEECLADIHHHHHDTKCYKFTHEMIADRLYNKIPAGTERELLHAKIGQIVWQVALESSSDSHSSEHFCFIAANHMNKGIKQITDYEQ